MKTEDAHPPHLRFNFAMELVHGILFQAGTASSEPMSVLPVFLEHFTSSRTMIGVFSALISGGMIGYKNYLLEIAPEPSRPAYLSLDGTLSGATMLLPVLGGVIADAFSYRTVFALALAVLTSAFLLSLRLKALRKREKRKAFLI